MNKLLVAIMFVIVSTAAYADVYVIADKNGSIYSISEKNDTVAPAGYEIVILKSSLSDLALTRPVSEYTLSGKKLKIDAVKVKASEDKEIERQNKEASKKTNKESAVNKLKVLGLNDEEIEALIK